MKTLLVAMVSVFVAGCSTVAVQYDPYMIYKYRYESWETTDKLAHRYICVNGYMNCDVFMTSYKCQCGDYLF